MSYPAGRHAFAALLGALRLDFQCTREALPALALPDGPVLCLAPHPDDETIACGGLLRAAADGGLSTYVLLATDAQGRGMGLRRMGEYGSACDLLGVPENNRIFLRLPDGGLPSVAGLASAVRSAVAATGARTVLAPHVDDMHGDHAALGRAAAGCGARILSYLAHFPPAFPRPRRFAPEQPLLPPAVLDTGSWRSFPLSEAVFSTKWAALRKYRLETRTPLLASHLAGMLRRTELYEV